MNAIGPLRVLLIGGTEPDIELVIEALRKLDRAVEHERVETPLALRAALASGRWDIVLSAWAGAQLSALDALALMRNLELDLPFLVLADVLDEEKARAAFHAGAHDYVVRDRLGGLGAAIERARREVEARVAKRNADRALRLHAERFYALIQHSREGVLLISRKGRVIFASAAATRILPGIDGDAIAALQFVHPEDRIRVVALFREQLKGQAGKSESVECRALLLDGSLRRIEAVLTNLLADVAVGAIVVNVRDVTTQADAIDGLRASEARFKRLSDSGIIGIVHSDTLGNTYEANDAYLKLIGYSREELLSGSIRWTDVTPPEGQSAILNAVKQLRAQGVATPWETELLRKDGQRVPVLTGVAMLDSPRCIMFVADLSERDHAQAALKVSEDQLRHAQKMEAVGRLAGGIAHDFNNALSVILSYAELVLNDVDERDPLREDIEEIKKAGERAANLTRQLLLFSRQEVMKPRVLELNAMIAQMDKMLLRLVGEDITVTFLPSSDLGRIKLDPGHIEQVVMNLVVNARDAMPTGGRLTIETENVHVDSSMQQPHFGLETGDYVMLAVSDTGGGMTRETQARIFEPFFTTKPIGKGTGLGLSTVFGIVQQGGGGVWLYSEVGHGTTFKVYLPRVDQPIDDFRSASPLSQMGTETILVIEDEVAVRTVACDILRRRGYQVLEAKGALEAISLCAGHAGLIDLIVTDVVMPEMNGPEVAKHLLLTRPDLRVLYMSGYTDDAVVRRGVLTAEMAFLQKPFTLQSLSLGVREALTTRR